jgi:hypothetical protein
LFCNHAFDEGHHDDKVQVHPNNDLVLPYAAATRADGEVTVAVPNSNNNGRNWRYIVVTSLTVLVAVRCISFVAIIIIIIIINNNNKIYDT